MWNKINKIYNKAFKYIIATFVVIFYVFVIVEMLRQSIQGELDSMNFIALIGLALSYPGIVKTLAEEVNPKPEIKKIYKLSCRCPKCKNLVQMDMKEE